MKTLVCKGYDIKAKDDGTIEAYVSVFGNKDLGGDRIITGAFAKSLTHRTPKVAWSHDTQRPIGKTLTIEEVPANDKRLPEEIKQYGGLYVKGALALKTRDGADMYEHLKFGSIDEFSIGYEPIVTRSGTDGANELTEIDLYEWSPVMFGMNPITQVVNVKNLTMEQKTELMDLLIPAILEHASAHADMRGKAGRTVSRPTHTLVSGAADSIRKGLDVILDFLKTHNPDVDAGKTTQADLAAKLKAGARQFRQPLQLENRIY